MNGSLLKISEIHRDLSQAAHQEARALEEAHAAARKAHRLRNLLRDFDIRCVQEDVVGNQEFSSAHYRRPCRGMNARFANIGAPRRIGRDLGANSFELSSPNI